jgi:chromosomal replication initiation ATPase DnaA
MRQERGQMRERQIPLDLPVAPAFQREDLIVTKANRMAVDMIDAWPDWPGSVLVLCGPPGSGKSHIASAWASASGAAHVPIDALATAAQENALNYVVEDAGPGNVPEQALFHLLNHVRAEGGSCLITSRSLPSSWQVALPDLASRLRAAHFVEISAPDDALLSAVMVKLFADRQMTPASQIIDYLISRMERSLEFAGRLVTEIDRETLARGTKVSKSLVGDVLSRLQPEMRKQYK